LFRIIMEQSGADIKEMYKVFNMGHRLELYVPQQIANDIISISKSFNIDAQIIGYCESADKKALTIKSEFGEYKY
jgi:phosphoribosylformylglycinamidine cyclo-ligase